MSKRLSVKKQGIEISELTQEIPANGIITVGNDPASIIELADANIAAEQFVIVCEEEKMTLLSRADGNLINDNSLPQGALHLLETGDEITVGEFVIILDSDEIKLPQTKKSKSDKLKEKQSAKLKTNENESVSNDADEIHQSLSGVLAGLRTEEKFYFEVNNVLEKTETRFYVDAEEMALGWTADGKCLLTSDPEELATPQSIIRKDWTGVVISPLRPKSVWVNNLPVTDSHRLKNDDKVTIAEKDSKKQSAQNIIKFHEPTALLVLDSILPKELPPPVSLDERKSGKNDNQNDAENGKGIHTSQSPQKAKKPKKRKLFFGFFTLTEIIIMIIGTLITAVIIFLILELY